MAPNYEMLFYKGDANFGYMIGLRWLVGWLVVFYVPGHLEMSPQFTVSCEGCEHRFHGESNPGSSHGSPLHYHSLPH